MSRFATTEGALAYYSSRVLAERDPKQLDLRQLPGQRYSALDRAMATVFRAPFVVEAHYSNARQAPAELHAESARVLPRILARLGQDSVKQRLPASVRRLPNAERLEHGLSFEATAAFGIVGLGQAATGYYERSSKRYRVTVSEAEDPGSARDVYHALRRLPGRRLLKNMPFDAFEIREVTDSGAVAEWLVGKLGGVVVAVMDEPFVLGPGTPTQRHTRCLDRNEKLTVLRSALRGSR